MIPKINIAFIICFTSTIITAQSLKLNDKGYFATQGLEATVFDDIYPDGHQTGVTIIQHGERVVANGDLRLEPSPGQWSPVPKGGRKAIDKETQTISQEMWYPDSTKNKVGFNPIDYPDLKFKYKVHVNAVANNGIHITVDLLEPLPIEWRKKVGFNIELFPEPLFGKNYIGEKGMGTFTTNPYGPIQKDADGAYVSAPLCIGKSITIAPESEKYRMTFTATNEMILIDGRVNHNNGWYIIRLPLSEDGMEKVVDMTIFPHVIEDWRYTPVIQVSQVGYHPSQKKIAVIETDPLDTLMTNAVLTAHHTDGTKIETLLPLEKWGKFLRYNYYKADFSKVREEGVYTLQIGKQASHSFRIAKNIFENNVWQPVLEYFLPIQMCHVRVADKYRLWHDYCHLDDALMAPTDINHFDGYVQGKSTLTKFKPFESIGGLNVGGWHDAGDDDMRIESQIGTVRNLAYILEEFDIKDYDVTKVLADKKIVEIHEADGKSDIIQQIEHGLSSILSGYKRMGRLYRGIITNTLKQYVFIGDFGGVTDNLISDHPSKNDDDRWVFTEDNPDRELYTAAGLAATATSLKPYDEKLAKQCMSTARELYKIAKGKSRRPNNEINTLVEMIRYDGEDTTAVQSLLVYKKTILQNFDGLGWSVGRIKDLLPDRNFYIQLDSAAKSHADKLLQSATTDSPYGVPYKPNIWGAGWQLQEMGVREYFFAKSWPKYANHDVYTNALNFILGVHPGSNTASFASGVGANSLTVAYGMNRADWSYIPGGVGSGTALIRPDLPELKRWPYFWQQTEYVMGGGSTDYMFLVLAVRKRFGN
jgi:endoglucanase